MNPLGRAYPSYDADLWPGVSQRRLRLQSIRLPRRLTAIIIAPSKSFNEQHLARDLKRVMLDAIEMLLFVLGGTLADLTGPVLDECTAKTSISKIAKSSTRKSSAFKAANALPVDRSGSADRLAQFWQGETDSVIEPKKAQVGAEPLPKRSNRAVARAGGGSLLPCDRWWAFF